MLVMSDTRYVPTAVNMMVLQGEDKTFYYAHRSLYDQCVILHDQYSSTLTGLYKLLGCEDEHPAVCDKFMETVPVALNILGPFLSLVNGCEELETMEELCGAISSMSMSVDFRQMFKVPMEVRASIKFSLSVKEEYRVQWDRFFMETPTLEEVLTPKQVVVAKPAPAYTNSVEADADDEDDEEEYEIVGGFLSPEELSAKLAGYGVGDSTFSDDEDEEDDEEEDAEEEDAEEDGAGDKPKVKTGFAMLKGMV